MDRLISKAEVDLERNDRIARQAGQALTDAWVDLEAQGQITTGSIDVHVARRAIQFAIEAGNDGHEYDEIVQGVGGVLVNRGEVVDG